jgi:hypothetical protein
VISEFFIWVMASTARLVLGLFPVGPSADQAPDAMASGLGTVLGYAGGFGNWIPWTQVGPALLVVLGLLLAAGGVKLVRIAASFLTFGGGSAA